MSCLEDLFAFPFYAWCMDGKESNPNSGEDAECVFFRPRGKVEISISMRLVRWFNQVQACK